MVDNQHTLIATIDASLERAIGWMTTMLPEPDGSAGVWERIRIDIDEIVPRVRPDSTAETRELYSGAASALRRPELATIATGLGDWMIAAQNPEGSFPFYEFRAVPASRTAHDPIGATPTETGATLYPNDNGKVLELLALWPEGAAAADRLAAWLIGQQNDEGWFPMDGQARFGPCFVAWPAAGLARYAAVSGSEAAAEATGRAIRYLSTFQLPDGRLRTSYEVQQRENWRPVSSEAAEALRAFSLAHRLVGIDLTEQIEGAATFLRRLTTADGAIRNCDEASAYASQQNDASLTDLVYTCGYALHGWLDAWRATGDAAHLASATHLAQFLMGIQVADETVAWDGAWRGSYDVDRRIWRGRANQSNPIDEGGEFSVYTGWTTTTIATGLLRLRSALTADPS